MARRGASKKMRKATTRVSVVLSGQEYARLADVARSSERSMSWLGRYALRRLLQQHEGGQLPLQLEMPER